MDMNERRSYSVEFRVEEREDKSPVIKGHAAVFDQLSENLGGFREMIAKGAFKDAIKEDDVRALFNHNSDHVLGRNKAGTLRMKEDSTGLAIEIDPPDTQVARDLMISIERGDIDQMSFGFSVKPNGENIGEDDDGNMIRTLTDVRLFDVSPVTYPAYPQTDVAMRSVNKYLSEHEVEPPVDLDVLRKKLDIIELV
jgi:hypothetical protein